MSARPSPWNQAQASQIENVRLPLRIQCLVCRAVKLQARYSNRQLNDYRGRIYYQGESKATRATCMTCSPTVRTEMYCTGCGTDRPLGDFSKAQRKKPDDAKCIPCQQTIDDTVPNVEAAIEEDEIIENAGTSVQASIRGSSFATPLTGTGSGLTLGSGRSGVSVNRAQDATWDQPVAALGQGRAGSVHSGSTTNTNTTTTSAAPIGTGWDVKPRETQAYHERRVSSVTASSRGNGSTNPGFARQGAVLDDAQTRAARQLGRNERRANGQGSRRDDDDDDDAGGDGWEL